MPLQGYIFDLFRTVNNIGCTLFYEIYKSTATYHWLESAEYNFDLPDQSFDGKDSWGNSKWRFFLFHNNAVLHYTHNQLEYGVGNYLLWKQSVR